MERFQRAMVNANKRFLGAIRSKKADDVLTSEASHNSLVSLAGHDHVVVVTYKKDGSPIPQPVWPGYEDGKLYVWTEAQAFKARRLRNNPEALLAPSSFRGVPLAPPIAARGRVLEAGPESDHAARVIHGSWGWKRRTFARVSGLLTDVVYIEFVPAGTA